MATSHQNLYNFSPIIGILCMDIAEKLLKKYGNDKRSYIAVSYVKYLESAGATVIPVWINRCRSYYEDIMSKINGILLPGGAVHFAKDQHTDDLRNDCVQSSKFIIEIAEALCKNGKQFPVWGTCLGFQLMLTHSANNVDIRRKCNQHMNCWLPVKFEDEQILENSKLFADFDKTIKDKMSKLPFGCHSHTFCITKEDLSVHNIAHLWRVLASNNDENGLEFITIVEHNEFPFFGSQIHPERVMFDYMDQNILMDNYLEYFELTQYFVKFFVNQCNLNQNLFDDNDEIFRCCIHNFSITNTGAEKQHWKECYLFRNDIDYLNEMPKGLSKDNVNA